METEYLLTATRSARKSLGLDAPVDMDDILGFKMGPSALYAPRSARAL